MTKLFIDIDGTITSHQLKGEVHGHGLKDDLDQFFIWATKNFDCYWLSNWVPRGRMLYFKKALLPLLPSVVASIKPGLFSGLKTEAIQDGDFFWLDDNLLTGEKQYLEEHGWLDRFIHVDSNATSMAPVTAEIKRKMSQTPEGLAGGSRQAGM